MTPTIMEPLRSDWKDVQAAVQRLMTDGKDEKARELVRDFHTKLCHIRVLDPACGSGNFLYVALEMIKRLEGEVIALLDELGDKQITHLTVDPHQFLGIELNPWAANVAELVLWIGFLQWHFRTHGKAAPSEPVLRDFKNIKNMDALLEWENRKVRLDDNGNPVTRWDGVTTMCHPVTGEEVPDPDARVQIYDYIGAKERKWPDADFIVGNPPFIGLRNIRRAYADGYLETLRGVYKNVPENADYVMYWWEKAALAVRAYNPGKGQGSRRFGLITTNSLRQSFNRAVSARHLGDAKKPMSLVFCVPDHPWVDSSDGAAVRISMTVAVSGRRAGQLLKIASEKVRPNESDGVSCEFSREVGSILPDLRIGADLLSASSLASNDGLCCVGYQLTGQGFLIEPNQASAFIEELPSLKGLLKPWIGGVGIQRSAAPRMAIDVCHLTEEELRSSYPTIFQHLADRVLPERKENTRRSVRERWWIYGESRNTFRPSLKGIDRMIVSSLTASNRIFVFVASETVADSTTVMFALDGGEHLAVMSSRFHIVWVLGSGGTLEDRPRYNKSRCFDPFPFPDMTEAHKSSLSSLGEELDAHRKKQQKLHPKLTLTQMYNVLEKLRAGEKIEGKDREIYDQGLIGILKDLHDQIDVAVADAYGWPVDLSDEEILMRLVDLNRERVAEEAKGHVRWLRPEYQNPDGQHQAKSAQAEMDVGVADAIEKAAWPKALPEQIAAVREALEEVGEATPEQIARRFKRARTNAVEPLLESLAALGQASKGDDGRYAA